MLWAWEWPTNSPNWTELVGRNLTGYNPLVNWLVTSTLCCAEALTNTKKWTWLLALLCNWTKNRRERERAHKNHRDICDSITNTYSTDRQMIEGFTLLVLCAGAWLFCTSMCGLFNDFYLVYELTFIIKRENFINGESLT